MHWIRHHRHVCAHLALFALVLQLVLSFGHFHYDDLAFAKNSEITAAAPQTSASGDTAPDSDGHAGKHDFCAICATINLAASTVLPDDAALPLPLATGRALVFEPQTTHLTFHTYRSFQARAPPAVS